MGSTRTIQRRPHARATSTPNQNGTSHSETCHPSSHKAVRAAT